MSDGIDSRISLRRLEVFALVVETGGVTRAAERLRVAQPAVTAQLRSLEASVGAPLFARVGNGLQLTEVGRRVHRWTTQVLAGGAQLHRTVAELAAGTAGTVSLAASMALGTYLLPPLLLRVHTERPQAEIIARVDQPAGAQRAVQTGDADLAVLTWTGEDPPDGLIVERLGDEPVVLCASATGPPVGDTIEPRDLVALPLVASPPEVALQRLVERQVRAAGGELRPVIRLGHAEAMKRAAVELGAVALLPRYCVLEELARGVLREVRIAGVELNETIGLHLRADALLSPLQDAVAEAVRHQLGRPRVDRPARVAAPPASPPRHDQHQDTNGS